MKLDPINKQKLALRVAVISGIFASIIAVIMLLNYWQLRQTDPIESKLLETMVAQLENDRQNEALREQIRSLDLMTRKAYFTKQWQIRTGGYLLVGSMVVLVLALRVYHTERKRIEEPETGEVSLRNELMVSRRWVLSLVILLFSGALVAAFLSSDHLSDTYALAEAEPEQAEAGIQEIAVRSAQDGETATGESQETTSGNRPVSGEPEATTSEQDGAGKAATGQTSGADKADSEAVEMTEDETGSPDAMADADAGARDEAGKTSATAAAPTRAELTRNYPSFRGPLGLGIAHQSGTPVDWDGAAGKNIIWKAKIPLHGYNSPVIWGDKLFLSGANAEEEVVYCYDRNTGKLLWQHTVSDLPRPGGEMMEPTEDTGYAAPTLATDGRFVTAIFATGDVVCLDMQGNKVWSKNLGVPENHYGHSSSLLTWQDLLLIQYDDNRTGKVMALDIRSGEERWTTLRDSGISWASPILAPVEDHFELILTASPVVASYDPLTGNELWKVECLSGEVGPSPAFSDGTVFAANEYAVLVAITPGSPAETRWQTNEYLPEVSSPVAQDGLLYIATSYGVIACYNAENGEILWEYECDQGVYASPIIADGKVYILDMDGIMHIFESEKTMKLVGEPALGETTVTTPAFAGDRIYIRGSEFLYCIGNK